MVHQVLPTLGIENDFCYDYDCGYCYEENGFGFYFCFCCDGQETYKKQSALYKVFTRSTKTFSKTPVRKDEPTLPLS
jgi:hypothetical protein